MVHRIRVSAIMATALLLASAPLSAQNVLTLHAGASIATFGGADVSGASSRTGVNIGASLTLPVTDVLGIQIGGAYAQKGATDRSESVDATLAIDYIDVPVLLRIGIPSSSALSAHLLVGPAVSFQAKCSAKGTSQGTSVSVDCSQFGADIKNIDFGAMGGLGIDIAASERLRLSFDLLYDLGLTTIDNTSPSADIKNRAFTIQAGLGFPLG